MAKVLLLLICTLALMPALIYSLTVPSNIVEYLPISLTNFQGSAVAVNTPIAIGTVNSITGNIIGFNAIAYQQYYTCNLNNAEFFFSNGTVANSWLEGNLLNEQDANSVCTSASSQNALVDSANVLYWVLIPSGSFLTANSGTATTNTIYLGWTGNYLSSANTLMNNLDTGEAPQLSCATPYNTIVGCSAGQYGEYDDGANVFTYYYNYAGTSIPSGLSVASDGASGSAYANNGLQVIATNTAGHMAEFLYLPSTVYPGSNVLEALITSGSNDVNDKLIGWDLSSPASQSGSSWWGWSNGVAGGLHNSQEAVAILSGSPSASGSSSATPIFPTVASIPSWASTATAIFNYSITKSTSSDVPSLSSAYPVFGFSSNGGNVIYQWGRIRMSPPGGVMPGAKFGTVTLNQYPTIFSPATPAGYNIGQTLTIGAKITPGTSPYTYNYIISNSITKAVIYSQQVTNSLTGNVISITIPSSWAGNTIQANVTVTENGAVSFGSTYSTSFMVNQALTSNPLYISNSIADQGQYETITQQPLGTSVYTSNIVISNGINAGIVANSLVTNQSSISFTTKMPSTNADLGTLNANALVNDSSTLPVYAAQFNGLNSYINVANPSSFNVGAAFSLSGWFRMSSFSADEILFSKNLPGPYSTNGLEIYTNPSGQLRVNVFDQDPINSIAVISGNAWYQFTVTFTPPTTFNFYVDGTSKGSGTQTPADGVSENVVIGTLDGGASFNGIIENMQFYNATLSAAQIEELYQEGISGVPVLPANVVGWWPLSGNANDYSANGNNGISTNVIYTNNVISTGYAPTSRVTSSNTLTVNTAPSVTLTPSTNSVTSDQSVTFTVTVTGGTGPFNVQLYNVTGAGNQGSQVYVASSGGSNTVQLVTGAPGSFTYNAVATDIGTTTYMTFNSVQDIITVASQAGGSGGGVQGSGGSGVSGPSMSTTTSIAATTISTQTTTLAPLTTAPQAQPRIVYVSAGKSQPISLCNNASVSGFVVNYTSMSSSFAVTPHSSQGCFDLAAINVTGANNVSAPANLSKIISINVTSSSANATIVATIAYPCNVSSSSVSPYILRNGTWSQINPFTVNAAACTISFTIPADPVIAVFVNMKTSYTTVAAIQQSTQVQFPWFWILIIIIVIFFILAITRRRRKKRNET